MARNGFDLDATELIAGIEGFSPRLVAAMNLYMDRQAAQAEAYMKLNAPWTDRSGLARGSLSADGTVAGGRGGGWSLLLSGSAPYQVYLELKYAGRDAIIDPTLRQFGPKVMAGLSRLIDRMGR